MGKYLFFSTEQITLNVVSTFRLLVITRRLMNNCCFAKLFNEVFFKSQIFWWICWKCRYDAKRLPVCIVYHQAVLLYLRSSRNGTIHLSGCDIIKPLKTTMMKTRTVYYEKFKTHEESWFWIILNDSLFFWIGTNKIDIMCALKWTLMNEEKSFI